MNFHGDLDRHLIRNYLYELIGNLWIYGYMDIWIWTFNEPSPIFVQFSSNLSNVRQKIVDVSFIFRRFVVKMSDLLFKFRQNVVNLGPWANELEGISCHLPNFGGDLLSFTEFLRGLAVICRFF